VIARQEQTATGIPMELRERLQWVAWRPEEREGKTTKTPVNPMTGKMASATERTTWGTYAEAQTRAAQPGNEGIGFVFSADDPYMGIDLDKCRDPQTGEVAEWARRIISELDSYAEVSPSGTGVHIIVRANKAGEKCKVAKPGVIEMYDQARYFTMTGNQLAGAPGEIRNRQAAADALYLSLFPPSPTATTPAPQTGNSLSDNKLIERAMKAKNGANFSALWNGDTAGYNGDDSAADLALCCHLMFWTGNDVARTDSLFRQSGLYRGKWNERRGGRTYGEMTLEKAMLQETYSSPRQGGRPPHLRIVDPETGEVTGDTLPQIDAGDHNLPEITRVAWDALLVANDPPFLFQYGGAPVRLQRGEDGRMALVPLTEHRLRCEVAQAAAWFIEKGQKRTSVAAEPPLSVIQNMLAQAALPLPILRRIVGTPVFAADDRLIEAAGYDAASGVYLEPVTGLTILAVPAQPSGADMDQARSLICDELLGDFPFESDADKAGAIALLILPFVRDMIDGNTPMHGIESPTVGSGKGLLADSLTHPAFGSHGETITQARDDDEWRKRIGSKIKEGAELIQIDNLTLPLDSGALASALTTRIFSDRLLGRTETFRAPIRCAWVFTANNPTLSTEIARRTIRIRIDPQVDRPWQRTEFRHKNLKRWTAEHRGALIAAALTLARGWIVAGKQMADVSLGSYEQWAGIIGGILTTAGIDGFLTNLDEFYETADSEGAAWRQLIARWWEEHKDQTVGAKDIFPLAQEGDGLDFGKGNERSQQISFGLQLMKQRDRVYDSYRIVSPGTARKVRQWKLLTTKPGGGVSPQQTYTSVSLDIATDTGKEVYVGVSSYTPPAEKNSNYISGEQESGEIHRHTPGLENLLVAQGKKAVYVGVGDTPPADPTDDTTILYKWAVSAQAGYEKDVSDEVRQCAQRCGFTFDAFAAVRDEAARLDAHLQSKERTA